MKGHKKGSKGRDRDKDGRRQMHMGELLAPKVSRTSSKPKKPPPIPGRIQTPKSSSNSSSSSSTAMISEGVTNTYRTTGRSSMFPKATTGNTNKDKAEALQPPAPAASNKPISDIIMHDHTASEPHIPIFTIHGVTGDCELEDNMDTADEDEDAESSKDERVTDEMYVIPAPWTTTRADGTVGPQSRTLVFDRHQVGLEKYITDDMDRFDEAFTIFYTDNHAIGVVDGAQVFWCDFNARNNEVRQGCIRGWDAYSYHIPHVIPNHIPFTNTRITIIHTNQTYTVYIICIHNTISMIIY